LFPQVKTRQLKGLLNRITWSKHFKNSTEGVTNITGINTASHVLQLRALLDDFSTPHLLTWSIALWDAAGGQQRSTLATSWAPNSSLKKHVFYDYQKCLRS